MNKSAVAIILSNEKLYASDKWQEALLSQNVDLKSIYLIIITEYNHYACLSLAKDFSLANEDKFNSIKIIESVPIETSDYFINELRSGKKALLRQQVLNHYLSLDISGPLIFWNADLEWDSDFLLQSLSCSHPIFAAPYNVRGRMKPMIMRAELNYCLHLQTHEIGDKQEFDYVGGAGWGAQRYIWQTFQDIYDGWQWYGHDEHGNVEESGYGEERYLARCLNLKFNLLSKISGWHWDNNGTAIKLKYESEIWEYYIKGFGHVSCCSNPNKNHDSLLTIAIPISDSKKYSIPILTKSLENQKHSHNLKNVRILFYCQNNSYICNKYLTSWKTSIGDNLFKDIYIINGEEQIDSVDTPSRLLSVIAKNRQALMEFYLSLTPDQGIIFWDSDHDWEPGFLSQASGCGWPIATGIMGFRKLGDPSHYDEHPQSLPIKELATYPTCRYNGCAGLWINHLYCKEFMDRGGWNNFDPDSPHGFSYKGEDWFLCANILPPALLLHDISSWHHDRDIRVCLKRLGKTVEFQKIIENY